MEIKNQVSSNRSSISSLIANGTLGGLIADLISAPLYVYFGERVFYEVEWVIDVWFFLVFFAILSAIAGLLSALLSRKFFLNTSLNINRIAFLGGALQITLGWLIWFILTWNVSARLRGSLF